MNAIFNLHISITKIEDDGCDFIGITKNDNNTVICNNDDDDKVTSIVRMQKCVEEKSII